MARASIFCISRTETALGEPMESLFMGVELKRKFFLFRN
jgi:hypothetical protein